MQPTGAGVLQVEPTDHCNLRCRMCAPHREGWETVHGVPKGMLSVELWEKLRFEIPYVAMDIATHRERYRCLRENVHWTRS